MAFVISALQVSFVSCSDDPGAENYYTSTSEYASDFLRNRDKFSKFVKVVEQSNKMHLLSTYGQYTVFAPTNEAFDLYLAGRGWTMDSLLSHQADCDTITLTHIIENATYFTTDFSDGTYNQANMLDRLLTISCDSDILSVPGEVRLAMYINKSSRIIQADDSVENGVVHTMDKIIGAQSAMLPDIIGQDSTVSIFYWGLKATGMNDMINKFMDNSYSVGSDSVDWTNDALVISTATEYDNVAYPKKRLFKFTAFVEQNNVYRAEFKERGYDIAYTEIEDFNPNKLYPEDTINLKKLASAIYDEVYSEDKYITDLTNRRNSLNRFISYHLLNRIGTYYTLTCVDGPNSTLAINWDRRNWDIADWYETMMPHSLMKFSFPQGSAAGLYINRRGVQTRRDSRGVLIPGTKVYSPSQVKVDQSAVNGVYHYIDGIIHYGSETQDVVLDERLRFDASTLSPDFMNSGARGHYTKSSYENGKYGLWDNNATHNNRQTCLGFKAGFVENFKYDNATHLHVRPRVLSFWSYQGDEVTIKGIFDFTVKLPPVPAGTYELRLFTCTGFSSRGIIQAYIKKGDGGYEPCGIPFDMRPAGTDPKIGWRGDGDLGDDDAIAAFDKSFHNRGWMRGPHSYGNATTESGGTRGTTFANLSNTLRKVITTFETDGQTDVYFRVQQKMQSVNNEMNFDFIELCPSSVYNNEFYPEDRW